MKIIEVKENKKQYLDLLLLADEQEDMILMIMVLSAKCHN